MHKGDDVPVADDGVRLRDAVLTMTSKRIGATFIVDPAGRLRGILTDGDLRRVFQADPNPMDRPIQEILSRLEDFRRERFRQTGRSMREYKASEPKTVTPEMLAAEALRVMEELKITVLPVVDEENKPVGALHLHDLVKAGLA
jgi:arabinose-5-phosphate isomerase